MGGVSRLQSLSAVLSLNIENLSDRLKPVILFGVAHPLSGLDGMKDKDISITSNQGLYSDFQKSCNAGVIYEIKGLKWKVEKQRQLRYKLYVNDFNMFGHHSPLFKIAPRDYMAYQAKSAPIDIANFNMIVTVGHYMKFHMLPKSKITASFTIASQHDPRITITPEKYGFGVPSKTLKP